MDSATAEAIRELKLQSIEVDRRRTFMQYQYDHFKMVSTGTARYDFEVHEYIGMYCFASASVIQHYEVIAVLASCLTLNRCSFMNIAVLVLKV